MSFLNAVRSFIVVFNYFCMTFTIVLNLVYIVQLFVSFFRVRKDYDRHFSDDYLRYEDSENLMPISLIIPAYNEQENIVQNVRSLMKLNYPSFEIVVINDGSTDRTAELMVNSFHMSPIETSIRSQIPTRHIRKVYYSRKYPNLLFVDKDNGGKSDALNAGINISSYPLFTCLDADSRIEKDALLKLSLEFLKDSRTVVSGGLVRIANGSRIVNGELKGFTMPKKLVERFQIVEYYRSFLMGRVFWGATNSLLIVSGAFGLFRKQTVIDVGGYKTNTIGEDMEIVVRIHRYMRKNRKKYRISFNELAVCWTQGPMSIRDIRSQRRRWQIGLMDTLLNMFFFVMYFLLAVLLGVILSEGSLVLEQYTHRAAMTARQSIEISVYAILENFGYRQMISVFRVEGIIKYRKLRKSWGKIKRKEFDQ